MKSIKNFTLLALLICVLALPIAAKAANVGSYSFEISHQVEGSQQHSLANKSTSTTAFADTYYYSGKVHPSKADYSVLLRKSWLTSYGVSLTADGYSATKSFGTVSSGQYTVTVTKSSSAGDLVIGNGNIQQ